MRHHTCRSDGRELYDAQCNARKACEPRRRKGRRLTRLWVQFSKVGQAASKICRDRACQTPLNKSARKRAIWAAPVSDQRMPCNFNRAPVT